MFKRLVGIAFGTLIWTLASAQSSDDRLRDLERRVQQLEKMFAQPNSAVSATKPPQADGWKQRDNWRALKLGMLGSDVRSLLGEPMKIDVNSAFSNWSYPDGGRALFQSDNGQLREWSEPR